MLRSYLRRIGGTTVAIHLSIMNGHSLNPILGVSGNSPDLICLSHLRWNFVFQRPQHLMTRYARTQRVYFFEEPLYEDVAEPQFSLELHDGVNVVVPRMPRAYTPEQSLVAQRAVL